MSKNGLMSEIAINMQGRYETFKGEGLKNIAEASLETFGNNRIGQGILEHYTGGIHGRVKDPRLAINIAGIHFENPVMVGAGWDKKGRALHGLYYLGFGGAEVGTVLPRLQFGGLKPRLWTIDKDHSVGFNSLGFNSPGVDAVDEYLEAAQPLPFKIGISVGRNKTTENKDAAKDHSEVINKLAKYASYFVLGISSPNTPDLRGLQDKAPLRELIVAAYEAMPYTMPLFIKIDPDRTEAELHDIVDVGLEVGLSGIVATNSTTDSDIKSKYGSRWANKAGGLSGNDTVFRERSTKTVKRIYEEAGNELFIIGVGGINSAETALEKIKAGASGTQIVTDMRASLGKTAANINRGLIDYLNETGEFSICESIGKNTKRGAMRIPDINLPKVSET